jgi:hypothetical protein
MESDPRHPVHEYRSHTGVATVQRREYPPMAYHELDTRCNGVALLASRAFASTPCSRRTRAAPTCPSSDTRCNGVRFLMSRAFASAPCSRRSRATSSSLARCNGVFLSLRTGCHICAMTEKYLSNCWLPDTMPNTTASTLDCPAHSHLRHAPEGPEQVPHVPSQEQPGPMGCNHLSSRASVSAPCLRRTRAISTCPRRDDTCNGVSFSSKPRAFTSCECSTIRNVAMSCMLKTAA